MIGVHHSTGFLPQVCHSLLTQADLGYSIEPVFQHYRHLLLNSDKALAYLQSIGISKAVIENYQLGYSDRILCLEMASGDTSEGASLRGFLQSVGLIRPTGHERFWGAVMVPVNSSSGEPIAAYGRRFTKASKPRTAIEEFWSAGAPISLFNANCINGSRDILLCQNPLDALICISLGQSNVVATMGLNGLSNEQLEAISESGLESVTLLFENTDRGNQYAGLVAQALGYVGIQSCRAELPTGSNLSDYIKRRPYRYAALSDLLSQSCPFRQTMESILGGMYVS